MLTGAMSYSRCSENTEDKVRPTPRVSLDSRCSCPGVPTHLSVAVSPGMREIFPLTVLVVMLPLCPPCSQILLNLQDK